MISLSDFSVGQTVVVVGEGGGRTYRRATVGKVGRTYVTLSGAWPTQFFVRNEKDDYLTEKTHYGGAAMLYPSEDAYRAARTKCDLKKAVREACDWPRIDLLSLDQLQRIMAIIREGEAVKK